MVQFDQLVIQVPDIVVGLDERSARVPHLRPDLRIFDQLKKGICGGARIAFRHEQR